jgi:hypothetical protein
MADTTIEAVLRLKDQMSGGLRNVSGQLRSVLNGSEMAQQGVGKLQGGIASIQGALLQMAAAAGVSFGVVDTAMKMVDANREIEDITKKIGVLQSGLWEFDKDPAQNFRYGLLTAKKMVEEFDDAEGELNVDKGDMLAMAERLGPAFAQAGKDTDALIKGTKMIAGLAQSAGQNYEMLAQQVNMAVEFGMASKRSFLAQNLGITTKAMKEMKTEAQRMDYVLKKLGAVDPSVFRQQETLSNTIDAIKISIGNIYEDAGKPLFEKAHDAARKLLKYLQDNQKSITDLAERFANFVGDGLLKAVDVLDVIIKHFDTIRDTVVAIGTAWAAVKFANARNAFAGAGTTIGTNAAKAMDAAAIGAAIGAAAVWAMNESGFTSWLITSDRDREAKADADAFNNQQRVAIERDIQSYVANTLAKAGETANLMKMSAKETAEWSAKTTEEAKKRYWVERTEQMEKSKKPGFYAGAEVDENRVSRLFFQEYMKSKGINLDALKAETIPKGRSRVNNDFRNSKFNITQKFAEGFDPDRIAVAFAQDLARVGEMKLQSANALAGQLR